jgi:ubiquinone/menaquinone biosynthesis C-methylase UbiE
MMREQLPIDTANQTTFQTADVVRYYGLLQQLQPAEVTILALLEPQLATMTMLDLGVGAGRTIGHFVDAVASYCAIDYSADMIAACQTRFPQVDPHTFVVGDARDLTMVADDSCDFVLFSYNGIDNVVQDDRLKILAEVQRVGRSGGYFCFSSHHLTAFESAFDWRQQCSWNPGKAYVNWVMAGILNWVNRPIGYKQIQTMDHVVLCDEAHNFRLKQYYIRAAAQIAQLETAGFHDVQVYSWKTGRELVTATERSACPDLWLYYLCRIN